MEIYDVRVILGDTEGTQFSDEFIRPFLDEDNAYLAAASVLDARLASLLYDGAGANIKTDDLSINQYNNLNMLRALARDLRTRGEEKKSESAQGVALFWPSGARDV